MWAVLLDYTFNNNLLSSCNILTLKYLGLAHKSVWQNQIKSTCAITYIHVPFPNCDLHILAYKKTKTEITEKKDGKQ